MTLDDLQALLHKSLIQAVGADHFALHELVRQFAAEQLAQQPALQATVQARHAVYYLEFAQAQEVTLLCDFAAQQAIHRKLDNLRRAWQWSAAQGELALLTKGASSLFTFYRLTGLSRLYAPASRQPCRPAGGVSNVLLAFNHGE